MHIHLTYSEASKFMRNDDAYLDALITANALQHVVIPAAPKQETIKIKVVADDTEYYWVKHLTLQSTINDICEKLAPRLQQAAIRINLYKDYTQLPRQHTLAQLGLKDCDSVSMQIDDAFAKRSKGNMYNQTVAASQGNKRLTVYVRASSRSIRLNQMFDPHQDTVYSIKQAFSEQETGADPSSLNLIFNAKEIATNYATLWSVGMKRKKVVVVITTKLSGAQF